MLSLEMTRGNCFESRPDSGEDDIKCRDNREPLTGKASDTLSESLARYARQLRRQHHYLATLDLEHRAEALGDLAAKNFGLHKRNHDPRGQWIEQVRLHVEKVENARAGGWIGVAVDVELRHQNERSPSLKTPCFSTCSLKASIAWRFFRSHSSLSCRRTASVRPASSTCDRFSFRRRASRLRLKLPARTTRALRRRPQTVVEAQLKIRSGRRTITIRRTFPITKR